MASRAAVLIMAVATGTWGAACTPLRGTPTPVGSGVSTPASFVVTVEAPPPAVPNVPMSDLQPFQDPEGQYSLHVPAGWSYLPQQVTSPDIKVADLFQGPIGHVAVTQFDNGRPPEGDLGSLTTGLMGLVGVDKLPSYFEYNRGEIAGRGVFEVDMGYTSPAGIPYRSLVHVRVNGTRTSMVIVSLADEKFDANADKVRTILWSYRLGVDQPATRQPET